MKNEDRVLKVALCGPTDVSEELEIAKKVIDEWNYINWEAMGCGLMTRYWKTNSSPDIGERAQRVIDKQLIDDSDIVVAIFWRRLGTPTGLADSGTVEEIDRAIHHDIRTMVYFSNLEVPARAIDPEQDRGLEKFRNRIFGMGLAVSFASRRQFEADFRRQLGIAVHQILAKVDKEMPKRAKRERMRITQSGNHNLQFIGDGHTIKPMMPSKPKIIISQSPGQVTPAEQKKISDMVNDLADFSSAVTGKSEGASRAEMRSRFNHHFKVPRYNALQSSEMSAVAAWYQAVRGSLIRSPRAKKVGASDAAWKKGIKTRMGFMGRTNEDYYPEIAARLKIPQFKSLTELSSKRLEKVYNLVVRDSKKAR